MKWSAICLGLMLFAFGGCQFLNKRFNLPDDHFAEEVLEHKIEQETGMKIDLTPESPESAEK